MFLFIIFISCVMYTKWESLCTQSGNLYLHKVGIFMYTKWESLCTQSGNIYVHKVGIFMYPKLESLCTQSGNLYVPSAAEPHDFSRGLRQLASRICRLARCPSEVGLQTSTTK